MLFPIQQLIEGRGRPLCVAKETTVRDALALMVEHDYSQLPIVDRDDNLCGIITETSITRTYYHVGANVSLLDLSVDHCQIKPVTISPDRDIFEALDLLKNVYAIVVVEDDKPVGILTDYDTTHFFRDLSEGLILVEDIEVSLRQYIETAFPTEHVMTAALMRAFKHDKEDPTKPARDYQALSFWGHIQLITTEDNWSKFKEVFAPKGLFVQFMEQVREIRNQLAHFRGQLDPVQHDALIRARDWLEGRPNLASAHEVLEQTIRIKVGGTDKVRVTEEVAAKKPPEKYAPLETWLTRRKDQANSIRVSFEDIESLLTEPLPDSARKHRSWWSNDHTSHVQSLAWLRAGWRVDDVELTAEEVVFRQTNSVLMQLFFADLLQRLKAARPGVTRATKTQPQNWWSFSAGRTGFTFAWVFTSENELRVEVYIDTGDQDKNKTAFDLLKEQEAAIAEEVDEPITWQRMDDKQASRIFASTPATITDPPPKLKNAEDWALETMLQFVDAFRKRIKQLPDTLT